MRNRLLTCVAAVLLAGAATAQVNSTEQQISLNATLAESLSLTLSGNAVNFNLTPGSASNAGSTSITATTTWVLGAGRGAVKVNAYFATAAALTDGTSNIPYAAFQIKTNTGSFTSVTNTVDFGLANAGLYIRNQAINAGTRVSSATDTLNFNIDLTSNPQLPAGNYTGVLNIRAQAL